MSDAPPSRPPADATPEQRQECLEEAWRAAGADGPPPDWTAYLPPPGSPCPTDFLVLLLQTDIEYRLARGPRRPLVETYLESAALQRPWPSLDDDQLLELLRWEHAQRWRWGDRARRSEYQARFPRLADPLATLTPRWNCPHCGRTGIPLTDEESEAVACPGCRTTLSVDRLFAGPPAEPPTLLVPAAPRPVGQLPEVFGHYRVLGLLGKGGMGSVYLAEDTVLQRRVALKVPHASDPAYLERLRKEARAAAALRHPNLCPVYECNTVGGIHYLALGYVQGKELSAFVRADAPPSVAWVATVTRKLALALHYAHEHGVVHRDLKPAKVMLDEQDEPMVMDFGLARFPVMLDKPVVMDFGLARMPEGEASPWTRDGDVFGTPAYMAPEQASGRINAVDGRTDVYALGVILYELLTGRVPFQATTGAELFRRILEDLPQPPRRLRPDVPRDLETICLKCLEKEPGRRYASAGALADDLGRFLNFAPIAARPRPMWWLALNWVNRHYWRAAGAVLVVLALLTAAVATWASWQARRDAQAALPAARELTRVLQADLTGGQLLSRMPDQLDAGRIQLEKAAGLYETFLRYYPDDREVRSDLAEVYASLGAVTALSMKMESALDWLGKAKDQWIRLAETEPQAAAPRDRLANTCNDLAVVHGMMDRHDLAESARREAIRRHRRLAEEDGDEYLRPLANDWSALGQVLRLRGDLQGAHAAYIRAEALARDFAHASPGSGPLALAGILLVQGDFLAGTGQRDQAEAAFDEALMYLDRYGPDNPAPPDPPRPWAGQLDYATSPGYLNMARAVDFYNAALAERPGDVPRMRRLARYLYWEAVLSFSAPGPNTQAGPARALALARRANELYRTLAQKDHGNAFAQEQFQLCVHMAVLLGLHGRSQDVPALIEQAGAVFDDADLEGGRPLAGRATFEVFYCLRAEEARRKQRYGEALRDLRRACKLQAPSLETVNLFAAVAADADRYLHGLLHVEDYRGAAALAESLAVVDGLPGELLYDMACAFSKASADVTLPPQPRQRYAPRAVECLRAAFAAGFGRYPIFLMAMGPDPWQKMLTDSDLNAIREREDYRRWLEETAPRP